MKIGEYALPDRELINIEATEDDWMFWVPDRNYLILGQSNKAESSLHEELVEQDQVTVLKRPSGGESVILTPKTLVIAVRLLSDKLENPQVYFKKINTAIISGLESLGIKDLHYRGISDLAIGPKKILGSSIYRKKKMVFYHAVLNISENINLISKYLKHPQKEPDYRKGRTHNEFVTSISEQYGEILPEEIIRELDKTFAQTLS